MDATPPSDSDDVWYNSAGLKLRFEKEKTCKVKVSCSESQSVKNLEAVVSISHSENSQT